MFFNYPASKGSGLRNPDQLGKRTKHFSNDWITKVKEDMRLQQAEVGIIVTEAMPEGMTRFGEAMVDAVHPLTLG